MTDSRPITVLLVEDDPFVSHALRLALELDGMQVHVNATGRLAEEFESLEGIDIVVTDIIMPEVEGLELIRKLRSGPRDIPIIAISGGGRVGPENYLDTAKAFGANLTFRKPLDEEALIEKIRELVSGTAAPA